MDDNLVVIGAIDRSFGVEGDMLVTSLSDVPNRFRVGAPVHLIDPLGRSLRTVVTHSRSHGERLIIGVEAFHTPEEVRGFRGGYVCATKGEAPAPSGHFFQCDLLGLAVQDDRGRSLGMVHAVLETPAYHLFVVRGASEEHLIPAVKAWVLGIDQSRRVMTVRRPEWFESAGADSGEVPHAV